MPPGTVGNFHGQLVVLAVDGRFEPVLIDQAMWDAEGCERFHGIGQPVGGLGIAEHDLVEIDCRPRGADVAAAPARVVVVDLLHVEQPERARPHETDHLGEIHISVGDLVGLVKRGGCEEHSPGGKPAAGHGLVADGRAGVFEQRHGLRRLSQNEVIFGG